VRRLLLLLTISCLACRGSDSSGDGSTAGKCDAAALVELGEALARAPEHQQIAEVLPGLAAACGDALPAAAQSYYQPPAEPVARTSLLDGLDPKLEAMIIAACPDWTGAALVVADAPADQRATASYRACSFERFDVLAEHELRGTSPLIISWAVHRWLLDQGLTPAQARPITLALMSLERELTALVQPIAGQTWPTARGLPIPDGMVLHVTGEAIHFDGKRIVELEDGVAAKVTNHVIVPVFDVVEQQVHDRKVEHQSRGEDWYGALIIAADATTQVATIIDLLHTTRHLGFEQFGLVVHSTPDGLGQIPISSQRPELERAGLYRLKGPAHAIPQLAREHDLDFPGAAFLTVEIAASGSVTLSRGRDHEQPPESIEASDHAAIRQYAEAVKRDDPRARRVMISAEPRVDVQTLVSIIAAVRGPKCDIDELDCILPKVVLLPERAHQSDPRGDLPPTDDWEVGDDDGTIGLGNTGLIGKGGGPDLDSKPPPKVQQLKPTVDGALDADIIRRIVRAHINELRHCYKTGLVKDPKLAGEVTLHFVIGSKGKVGVSVVETTTLKDIGVANCMAKAVKRWTFPKPRGGGEVKVSYPFDLDPP